MRNWFLGLSEASLFMVIPNPYGFGSWRCSMILTQNNFFYQSPKSAYDKFHGKLQVYLLGFFTEFATTKRSAFLEKKKNDSFSLVDDSSREKMESY